MYREPGMHRGSMIGPSGDPIDSGPPIETTLDGRLRRAPLLRTAAIGEAEMHRLAPGQWWYEQAVQAIELPEEEESVEPVLLYHIFDQEPTNAELLTNRLMGPNDPLWLRFQK